MAQKDSSKTLAMKKCPLCAFEAPEITLVLSHLRVVHSSDPHFAVTCGLNGCATTSKSFTALYSHIYRRHTEVIKRYKRSSSQALDISHSSRPELGGIFNDDVEGEQASSCIGR